MTPVSFTQNTRTVDAIVDEIADHNDREDWTLDVYQDLRARLKEAGGDITNLCYLADSASRAGLRVENPRRGFAPPR